MSHKSRKFGELLLVALSHIVCMLHGPLNMDEWIGYHFISIILRHQLVFLVSLS